MRDVLIVRAPQLKRESLEELRDYVVESLHQGVLVVPDGMELEVLALPEPGYGYAFSFALSALAASYLEGWVALLPSLFVAGAAIFLALMLAKMKKAAVFLAPIAIAVDTALLLFLRPAIEALRDEVLQTSHLLRREQRHFEMVPSQI